MSYGDGGFYFLQPVNNGYGAVSFDPGYGKLVDGRKIGRYTMRYQKDAPTSVAEHKADIEALAEFLAKLGRDLTRSEQAQVNLTMKKNAAMLKGQYAKAKKLAAAIQKNAKWQRTIKKAQAQIHRNLQKARSRQPAKKATRRQGVGPRGQVDFVPSTPEPTLVPKRIPDFKPVPMPTGEPPDDYDDYDDYDDEGYENGANGLDLDADGSEFLPPGSVLPPGAETGTPVAREAESFYEKNRLAILLGAGGVGLWALVRIMRK